MSRLTRAAATMHTLSLAGMEEASRYGTRDADLEHLLLALTLDADLGGQVLRSAGLTLERVRAAVDAERATQLASLGIAVDHEPGSIVFHETSGYDWNAQALAVLNRSYTHGRNGSSIAVLRTLLEEPSGRIDAVLTHLGTTTADITADIDHAEGLVATDNKGSDPACLRTEHVTFVPADPETVHELLSDPLRIASWEPTLEAVSAVGEHWEGRAQSVGADGRPYTVKDDARRQIIERVGAASDIGWRFHYPDSTRSNTRTVTFRCEPAAGGTQLHMALVWERDPARRPNRVRGFLLRPVFRFLLYTHATQISSGVTRAFR